MRAAHEQIAVLGHVRAQVAHAQPVAVLTQMQMNHSLHVGAFESRLFIKTVAVERSVACLRRQLLQSILKSSDRRHHRTGNGLCHDTLQTKE
jgi:hypothetical protein